MINERSLHSIDYTSDKKTIKPHYEGYCFAQIPSFILSQFQIPQKTALPIDCVSNCSGNTENIIVFFIDGFGWSLLNRIYENSPLLKRFRDHGIVSAITSQFPSTTAAHVTTFYTGKPVYETGIFEWYMYEATGWSNYRTGHHAFWTQRYSAKIYN